MQNEIIAFTAPKVAQLLSADVPELKPTEVLVKLCISTISSGTERANLLGEVNVSVATIDTEAHFPRYCGYSSSGIVEKVGSEVTDFAVGDRVALSWSTHSKYVVIESKNLHKILDDSVSFEEAALWHIGTFPMAAIRKCRFEIGESAIVMGMGILGMFAVKLLAASGAAPLIAVDPVPEKRELALKIGADYAFDPFDPDFANKVKAVTDGGVNVAIEVTGNGGALNGVLDCMKRMGRVALLGCTRSSDFTVDYYHKVHGPGISLIGAHTAARPVEESSAGLFTTHDDVMAMQRLNKFGRLEFSSLIEETHKPCEAPEVYTRLANEKAFPIVQFDWRE
ncbi:MAG: zinc-binding alcohol dehydrogenase [Clostridia bacterium]|nr:zinc-binding alcohol dehydrogenase [Clostridia bacterium]